MEGIETLDFSNLTCKYCKQFIGLGDFNLCCKLKYDLCYEDTPACDLFTLNPKFAEMIEK